MPGVDELETVRGRALDRWELLCGNWRQRARRNKAISMVLTYLSVSLAVGATVLAAAPAIPKWLIALVSGGTALATALLAATKSQEQWVISRSIQNHLYAERFLYEQRAGRYAPETTPTDEARLRLFAERITEITLAGHNSWAAQISSTAPAAPASGATTPSA